MNPIPGREQEMVKNSAGGVTFSLDDWDLLDRFLILGSAENTYYATGQQLTLKATESMRNALKTDGVRFVARVKEISDAGRAPKNDPAIFALALAAAEGDADTVKAAWTALPAVCRIGTHLFSFVAAYNELGKWNAAAKRGIANWYNSKPVDKLAYQLLKYQNRNGWATRDVLRLAHVKPQLAEQDALYHWAVNNKAHKAGVSLPAIIEAFERVHANGDVKTAVQAIADYNISWEMLPTQLLREQKIWEVLLPKMGLTALLRNLGRMSSIGMTGNLSQGQKDIVARLGNKEDLNKSRVHPITVLNALKTYAQGRGDKGSLTWQTNSRIIDALNDAFYAAFGNIEPTGKSFLIGVDCSGSMFGARALGMPNLTAAEVAAVMALAVAKIESNYWIGGFNTIMDELKISPKMNLNEVLNIMRHFSWGDTDCALPMLHAAKHNMHVDNFSVWTDNQTWAGRIQPVQALCDYRNKFNNPRATLVVCGTTTTKFTIADPKDPGMMDIVGFDSAAPQLITDFVRNS
ncbi:MAG: TROVE domain-containing protein [Candidatus Nitrosotenuis sp.]